MKTNFIEEVLPVQDCLDEMLSKDEMSTLQGGANGIRISCRQGLIEPDEKNQLSAW